jgi:probable HAF family extracellular repeat protein
VAANINSSGQVVGYSYNKQGNFLGFLWQNGTMTSLGTLGGDWSKALAINDPGQITGQAYLKGNVGAHAFLYTYGTMKDIDTQGSTYSDGLSINSSGVVVGEMTVKCNCQFLTYHAFVYTGGKMKDLNSLIPAHSGWILTQASGINDSGQIVGWGTVNKQTHAFLLSPISK